MGKSEGACFLGSLFFGAGSKNRTHDLLITNQLLYHLSYAGIPEHCNLFYQRQGWLPFFF